MALSIDERIDRLWLRIFGFACDEWKEEEHKRDKAGRLLQRLTICDEIGESEYHSWA